jgi:glycosyltransferase involved in cell wall biosynthesis
MFQSAGVSVKIVPRRQLSSSWRLLPGYLAGFWPAVATLARTIRDERADIVHTNSLYCMYGPWAAQVARRPHILHVREIPEVRLPFAASLRLSDQVVAMSVAVASHLNLSRAAEVVFDGVDVEAFNPKVDGSAVRTELGVPKTAPLVGFVARLDPWKGADIFIRTAAAVSLQRPDAHFAIIGGELPGHEDHAGALMRLTDDLGLGDRVHFAGWRYPPEAMPAVMTGIDVLVHTAVRPEPFGLVFLEAMAAARPVVAADAGGVPEVVDRGVTGLLTAPGDWEAAAAAVLSLLNDRQRARTMGEAGRRRVECHFDVRAQVRKIEAVYERLLEQ